MFNIVNCLIMLVYNMKKSTCKLIMYSSNYSLLEIYLAISLMPSPLRGCMDTGKKKKNCNSPHNNYCNILPLSRVILDQILQHHLSGFHLIFKDAVRLQDLLSNLCFRQQYCSWTLSCPPCHTSTRTSAVFLFSY